MKTSKYINLKKKNKNFLKILLKCKNKYLETCHVQETEVLQFELLNIYEHPLCIL